MKGSIEGTVLQGPRQATLASETLYPLALVFLLSGLAWFVSGQIPVPDAFPLLLMGLALSAVTAYVSIHNERFWVLSALALHAVALAGARSEALAVGEIVYAVFVLGGLAIWLTKSFVRRERIIRSGFDVLLATFGILSTVVTLVASALHDGNIVVYMKEWGVASEILFYFPLRRVINTRRDVYIILALFAVVAVANSGVAILTYRQRLAEAVYQWQLKARSNVNEPTSIALLILSSTLFAYARKFRWALVGLTGAALGLIVLTISYSRSPIISGIIGAFIMAGLIPLRRARRVVGAMLVSVAIGLGVVLVVYPKFASVITSAVGQRLASVASASQDLSLRSRVAESERLVSHYIASSPVIGYGYGVRFGFDDPISGGTTWTYFIHNGYLWAAYKYGIPIALLLVGVIFYPLVRLLYLAPRRHDGLMRAIVAATTGYTLCVLIMNNTSTLFTGLSGMMNFALCWALLDFVHRAGVEGSHRPQNLSEGGATP